MFRFRSGQYSIDSGIVKPQSVFPVTRLPWGVQCGFFLEQFFVACENIAIDGHCACIQLFNFEQEKP
jgi:hypothetical protein